MMVAMQAVLRLHRLVKAYAREDHAEQRFERTNLSMTQNQVRWTKAMELVGPIAAKPSPRSVSPPRCLVMPGTADWRRKTSSCSSWLSPLTPTRR